MALAIIFIASAVFAACLVFLTTKWSGTVETEETERKYAAIDASRKQSRKYPVEVVGESHYQDALSSICGGYSIDGHALETIATLIFEDGNAYDPNAVVVQIQGRTVGYLSRDNAVLYRRQTAAATVVPAMVLGGWKRSARDVGYFGVFLQMQLEGTPKIPRKRKPLTS